MDMGWGIRNGMDTGGGVWAGNGHGVSMDQTGKGHGVSMDRAGGQGMVRVLPRMGPGLALGAGSQGSGRDAEMKWPGQGIGQGHRGAGQT